MTFELAPYRDELRLEAGEELARRHDQALRVLRGCPSSSPSVKLAIQTLDPTCDQRERLARLEERVVDGTGTDAKAGHYRELSANGPTMRRAVDLAVRGLLRSDQRDQERDLTMADLPLKSHLWVWKEAHKRWLFFQYLVNGWFDPRGNPVSADEMRNRIQGGAHVWVALRPRDPAPSDSVPDPIDDSPSDTSRGHGLRPLVATGCIDWELGDGGNPS